MTNSLLTDINLHVAAWLPAATWDWLELIFGTLVAIGTLLQRATSDRFRTSTIKCWADWLSVRLAQIGLAIIGTGAFVVALDGFLPDPAPPRAFVVLFLIAYAAIQTRTFYMVISAAFGFSKPPYSI